MRKAPFVFSILFFLAGATATGLFLASDDSLSVTEYTYSSTKVTDALDGFKIVHLGDLHDHPLAYKNGVKLLDKIDEAKPNLIVVSGDMIDDHTEEEHFQNLETLYGHLKEKGYPVYAVSGNHEVYVKDPTKMTRLRAIMKENGVNYPEMTQNAYVNITEGLNLACIGDPSNTQKDPFAYLWRIEGNVESQLKSIDPKMDKSAVNLLIGHRPELFDLYQKHGYDICYSGHTHGNQIGLNLPFALNQLPCRYIYGRYEEGNSNLIVSAGLGYSWSLPWRVGRNAEITVTTLKKARN